MSRYAPIVGGVVAVLLAVLFFLLVWRPLDDQETALVEETQRLEAEATQLRNQIAALREIQANETAIRADLARLLSFIPFDSTAQPAFIRQLQLQADASGVDITSVTFGDPEPVEGAPPTGLQNQVLAAIPVTMIVDGGYFQTVDFFRRLEVEVQRAVLVTDVTITEGPDGFPLLATTWTGQLFAVLPAVEAPPEPGTEGQPGDAATPAPSPTPTSGQETG